MLNELCAAAQPPTIPDTFPPLMTRPREWAPNSATISGVVMDMLEPNNAKICGQVQAGDGRNAASMRPVEYGKISGWIVQSSCKAEHDAAVADAEIVVAYCSDVCAAMTM